MKKATQHGKPGSPFGSGVVQFPEKPDPEEEVLEAPAEPEPEPEDATVIVPEEKESGLIELPRDTMALPTIMDFMDKRTVTLLTEEQRKALTGNITRLGYWMEAVMICEDHECAYKLKCPLFIAKIPRPRGQNCPVELAQTHGYKEMLMSRLSDEDRDDPFIEMQINDLVHIMMIEARAYGQFGIDGGTIEVDDVKGFNAISGEQVIGKVVNRAIGVLLNMGKRKDKILAKLLATPMDKAKADRDGVYDRSRKAAEIGDRIAEIAERRKSDMKREVYIIERVDNGQIKPTRVLDIDPD